MGSMALPNPRPTVPFTYIRGGTSKALFFHENVVPAPGPKRDDFLRRIMGSPDPMQIDGMGGSHIVTSKIALIKPSDQEGVDVDYTFVQIGLGNTDVDYSANCGNISSGVGPFAVDEGLLKENRPGASADPKIKTKEVRIFNTGTKKTLISHVPIDEKTGRSLEAGNFSIAGVLGTAAPILMDYRNVIGAALSKGILPTGNPIDTITIGDKKVEITICDVANIIVFARAADLGVTGAEKPAEFDSNPAFVARQKELRGKAAQLVGMCKDWEKVDEQSPMLPMVALVSEAVDPTAHIQSRLFLDNKCHTSMAGTGAICTTACSRTVGSVVNQIMRQEAMTTSPFNIQHPLGIMPVTVETTNTPAKGTLPEFKTLSFIRTARRIMDGSLYVPDDVMNTIS